MRWSVTQPGYLPVLDGWRAIAILMVLACHSAAGGTAQAYSSHATRLMGMMGPAGVEIFFGLSGFLITWRLLREFHRSGTILLSAFYRRRVFRILPAAFLYLVLMRVAGDFGWVRIDPTSWWGSIFFFRNYLSPNRDWITLHFWSLAVEEHFYLCWPLLLTLLAPRRALKASLAIIGAVVVWRACDWNGALSHGWIPEANFWFRTDTRIDFLLWGCVAALLCEHTEFRAWLGRPWVFPAAVLGYLAGMGGGHLLGTPWFSLGTTLRAASIPLLIISTVWGSPWINPLLHAPWMRWIGRISYSLYLWQEPFMGSGFEHLALRLAGAFLCATASYYLWERTFLLLDRSRREKPVAVPLLPEESVTP